MTATELDTPAVTPAPEPQWRASRIQLVNWGGFHGHHSIDLHPEATLLSGASGTGKSTIMDAYTALMMPADVSFNGASNDAVTGRARSEAQRNLPSYLRGKQGDDATGENGATRARVLRGLDTATWGAVAVTFTSTDGRNVTALRAYYLPHGVTVMSDGGTMKLAVIDDTFALDSLHEVSAEKFHARTMERRWPGMRVTTRYAEFSQWLFTRLGIGLHGDGLKAMRLLARIQAGHSVSTVDDLYKAMVLETPRTYDKADRAINHFTDLETAYDAMVEEEDKRRVLDGISDVHAAITRALDRAQLLDSFGVQKPGDTPMAVWAARVEHAMLADAETANRAERAVARDQATTAAADEASLADRLAAVKAEQDAAGGAALERLDREIATLDAERDHALDARRTFERHTSVLEPIRTADDLADAVRAAAAFDDAYADRRTALSQQRADLMHAAYPISSEIAELKAERDSLAGRSGRVPRDLHEARLAIARAAGLNPDDLPFVAELIDIPDEHADWRPAIETTLFGLARILLIDQDDLERVSRAIDPISLGVRVTFQGVPARDYVDRDADPALISGKLTYKAGPYTHWAAMRIASSGIDAACVDTPSELTGSTRKVTRSGQMRHGHSGAHGRSKAPFIIGFTSETRLAEIDTRQAELAELDQAIQAHSAALTAEEAALSNERAAYQQVQSVTWRAIDVDGIAADIAERRERKAAILASSDRLATLAAEQAVTETALEDARERKHVAGRRLRDLETVQAQIVDRVDDLARLLERVEQAGASALTEPQADALDALYAEHGTPGNLASFPSDLAKVASAASVEATSARAVGAEKTAQLVRTFALFSERWPDPDRGTTVADYPDYQAIVDQIVATGLAERRADWTRRVADWSGDDLVPLSGAFESSIDDIEDRLTPVNRILGTLDFGARHQHLRIDLSRKADDEVTRFRADLRRLASQSTEELTDDQAFARFIELRTFLNPLRARPVLYPDPRTRRTPRELPPSRRDALLDVRRHVVITAVAVDPDGTPRTRYNAIGHLSGGETQEIVAFIVGAALRYQLGDQDNTRPAFALVALDEAFIKADSEFTGRAIAAWKELGFQLVVSAPNEKTSGFEPQMDLIVAVTKSPAGYSRATPLQREAVDA